MTGRSERARGGATSRPVEAPRPEADAASAFFWAGLDSGRLLVQRCAECERFRFPPMAHCPYCRSAKMTVRQAVGSGTVYSWIVVHIPFHPAFATEVPYVLATVDFDEGVRIVVRVDDGDGIGFGQRVSAVFSRHPTWTELRVVADRSTPAPQR